MNEKKEWTVLVVDDQNNVVEGVVCGVHWTDIGITRVFKAYDAMGARVILLQNHVDILLCDIEMPGENGLQLYKWIVERGLDVECIFLTAHADFLYAKSAVQLGSFDYLLQPARYSEVENAVLRAKEKIIKNHEQAKFSEYGKVLFRERSRILDSIFSEKNYEEMLRSMNNMKLNITKDTFMCSVLLEILSWKREEWEAELFRYSCMNILNELLGQDGKVLMCRMDKNIWGISLWKESGQINNVEAEAVMNEFYAVASTFFACDLSVYVGKRTTFSRYFDSLERLIVQKDNNVALKKGVFQQEEYGEEQEIEFTAPDFQIWEILLNTGYGEKVYEEAELWLEDAAGKGLLSTYVLQKFYNGFVRILISVEEKSKITHEDIFFTPEMMNSYFNAHTNIAAMKEFLRIVTAYFTEVVEDEKKAAIQVEMIKEYIYQNLDKEIRREDIALKIFMNPSYVSRMFKKEEGISLKEFIVREKMNMAKALLKGSALPVSIVALKVGYSNFSHFSQVYKKTFGISPTEERK